MAQIRLGGFRILLVEIKKQGQNFGAPPILVIFILKTSKFQVKGLAYRYNTTAVTRRHTEIKYQQCINMRRFFYVCIAGSFSLCSFLPFVCLREEKLDFPKESFRSALEAQQAFWRASSEAEAPNAPVACTSAIATAVGTAMVPRRSTRVDSTRTWTAVQLGSCLARLG